MPVMRFRVLSALLAASVLGGHALAQSMPVPPKTPDKTRVMTYNIQWFHRGDSLERVNNIKSVIKNINPDVIGFQEIEGKAAIMQVLDESEWTIGFKDLPEEFQEVGIAVKKPYRLESYEFVFDTQHLDYPFPGKRDVLKCVLRNPKGVQFIVYVHHMKSRSGGRMQTDAQRCMAAGMLASYIANQNDKNVVVMGDFNDAPNDRSANILESGDVLAKAGIRGEYKLLANLTEDIFEKDYVTIGLHSMYNGQPGVNAKVVGAKAENDRLRDRDYRFPQDVKITQTFFDQIFASPSIFARGTDCRVYDGEDAFRGLPGRVRVMENQQTGARSVEYTENGTLASDHLPVYADITVQ